MGFCVKCGGSMEGENNVFCPSCGAPQGTPGTVTKSVPNDSDSETAGLLQNEAQSPPQYTNTQPQAQVNHAQSQMQHSQYGHQPQGYAPQPGPHGYPPQGHPPQGYPPQGYAPQGYAPQGYAPQPQIIVGQSQTTQVNVNLQDDSVAHCCHFMLFVFTAGLWTPFWVGACCGCCCRKPCG